MVDTEECGAEIMRVDDDAEIVLDGIFLSLCLIQAGRTGPGGSGLNGILERHHAYQSVHDFPNS